VRAALADRGLELAHLKMTLDSPEFGGQLAALSVTDSAGAVDVREALIDGVRAGSLIVNLRAEADPELLRDLTLAALERARGRHVGLTAELEHCEHFRPAPPTPTHRFSADDVLALQREPVPPDGR
jgi:hypothetical protein